MSKYDPIRLDYFRPVERLDKSINWMFYLSAALSIALVFIEPSSFWFEPAQTAFVVLVIAIFAGGVFQRLYFLPRAENNRVRDFLGRSFNISLGVKATDGYYNNNFDHPIQRVAAQALENSLFSRSISREMLLWERIRAGGYLSIWIICLIWRKTELTFIAAATQAVFSEQIISRYFRLEYARMNFERAFDELFALFQSETTSPNFSARAFAALTIYEKTKSNAGLVLSDTIFQANNKRLSSEWHEIKKDLGIP